MPSCDIKSSDSGTLIDSDSSTEGLDRLEDAWARRSDQEWRAASMHAIPAGCSKAEASRGEREAAGAEQSSSSSTRADQAAAACGNFKPQRLWIPGSPPALRRSWASMAEIPRGSEGDGSGMAFLEHGAIVAEVDLTSLKRAERGDKERRCRLAWRAKKFTAAAGKKTFEADLC